MRTAPLRPSVAAGDWVAVSGQVGLLDGALVDGGAGPQTDQALANLVEVLKTHGLTAADVVKTTVFLVSMEDYDAMNAAYAAVFASEPPARSAVAVRALPLGAVVEVEAWAFSAGS